MNQGGSYSGANIFHFPSHRKPTLEDVDLKAQTARMSEVTREELKASTAASEAKVAATLEIMRRENAEARAEVKAVLAALQADSALFREDVRSYIASGQVEGAQLREQVRVGAAELRSDFARHSKDVEGKVSGLKIWVLAGALTGAMTLLFLVARPYIPQLLQAQATQTQSAPAARP